MIRIEYIATRALDGHAIGDPVTLTFSAAAPLVPGVRIVRDQQKSMSNKRETALHNIYRVWNITTEPLSGSRLDELEEFLQAVADGSSFEFEPFWTYGADAADQDAAETRLRKSGSVSCTLASEQYDLTLFIGDGESGGLNDEWQVSFSVEESA